jgi:MFS family permease
MTDGARSRAGYALGLLTVINLLNYVERNAIFALFEPLKRDLSLTDAHLGWLASAYVLIFSIASLPLGVLSDMRSRPAVIAAGVGLWSVCTSAGGLVRGFLPLLLTRAGVGLGGAAAGAASTSLVATYFDGPRRALAMGVFMAGIPLGGVLGILIAGQLGVAYGWRVAFLALGVPGFIIGALASRLIDPTRPAGSLTLASTLHELRAGGAALASSFRYLLLGLGAGSIAALGFHISLGNDTSADAAALGTLAAIGLALDVRRWVRRAGGSDTPDGSVEDAAFTTASVGLAEAARIVLKTPTLLYVFAGGALISFGMNGIIGWAPSFMSRELGLSVGAVTLLLGKYGLIFGIAGTLAGGAIADALRKTVPSARPLVAAAGFIIGAPLAIWLLTIRDIDVFIPVFCAAFFFLTWYNGPLSATIFDVVPPQIGGTVVGAYLFFIHLAGDAIAFPLVGALSDRFGLEYAMFLLPIVALLGGLLVLLAARAVVRDVETLRLGQLRLNLDVK